MNQKIASAIVIICIFATFGTTYAVVSAYNDQEIINLKAKYELDIYNLNDTISALKEEIINLNNNLEENRFLGQWLLPAIEYFTFYKNKTTSTSSHNQRSTYEVRNGYLVIGENNYYNYTFSENDAFLVLESRTDGKTYNYTKRLWCEL
jgi:hypothetical protein